MAKNSFHKFISAARKSKNFKPQVTDIGFGMTMLSVVGKEEPLKVLGGLKLKEAQAIFGDTMYISSWKNEVQILDAYL